MAAVGPGAAAPAVSEAFEAASSPPSSAARHSRWATGVCAGGGSDARMWRRPAAAAASCSDSSGMATQRKARPASAHAATCGAYTPEPATQPAKPQTVATHRRHTDGESAPPPPPPPLSPSPPPSPPASKQRRSAPASASIFASKLEPLEYSARRSRSRHRRCARSTGSRSSSSSRTRAGCSFALSRSAASADGRYAPEPSSPTVGAPLRIGHRRRYQPSPRTKRAS